MTCKRQIEIASDSPPGEKGTTLCTYTRFFQCGTLYARSSQENMVIDEFSSLYAVILLPMQEGLLAISCWNGRLSCTLLKTLFYLVTQDVYLSKGNLLFFWHFISNLLEASSVREIGNTYYWCSHWESLSSPVVSTPYFFSPEQTKSCLPAFTDMSVQILRLSSMQALPPHLPEIPHWMWEEVGSRSPFGHALSQPRPWWGWTCT